MNLWQAISSLWRSSPPPISSGIPEMIPPPMLKPELAAFVDTAIRAAAGLGEIKILEDPTLFFRFNAERHEVRCFITYCGVPNCDGAVPISSTELVDWPGFIRALDARLTSYGRIVAEQENPCFMAHGVREEWPNTYFCRIQLKPFVFSMGESTRRCLDETCSCGCNCGM